MSDAEADELRELQDLVVEFRVTLYATELDDKYRQAHRDVVARLVSKARELTIGERRCLDHSNDHARKIGVRP